MESETCQRRSPLGWLVQLSKAQPHTGTTCAQGQHLTLGLLLDPKDIPTHKDTATWEWGELEVLG